MFKRLTKLFFVPIGLVLFCSEFAAVAEKADLGRYWAGHKAVLETETDGDYRACQLFIKYSNDGLTYSASVSIEANNAWPDGECSGKVDKFGNLERKECTPGTFNQRDIIGNVWAPELDDVDMGRSGGCQWKDQTLLTAKKTFIEKQDANPEKKLPSQLSANQKKTDLQRYWAGHKAILSTKPDVNNRACQLTIKYSNDGLTYSASVSGDPQKSEPGGKCSGKVDEYGNLEQKECTPGIWTKIADISQYVKPRDIIGTVWAPSLGGNSDGCQWKDQTLLTAKKTFIEKQDANSSQKLAGQRSTDPKKKSTSQLSTNLKKKSIGRLSTDLKNAVYAKTLLVDLKVFARKEPGVIDPQKLASLYFPVMQEIKSGEYKNSNSRFLELIDLIRQSSKFRNYHDSKMLERENKLKAQIDLLVKFIEEALSSARQKVTADPFSAHAANLNEVLEQYKTTPNNLSLKDLQKRASALQSRLRPLGVNADAGVALVPSADQSATPANALTVKKGSKKSTAKNTNAKSNNLANSSDKTLSKDDFLEKYFGKKNFNQLKEYEGLLGTVQEYLHDGQEIVSYFASGILYSFSAKATLLGVAMYKVENNALRFYEVAEPNSGSSDYLYGKPTKWSYVMFRKGNKAYSYNITNKTFKIKKLYNDLDEVKRLNVYPFLHSLSNTPAGKSWILGQQLWRSFEAEYRTTNARITMIQRRNKKLKEKKMVSANNQSFDTYKKRPKTLGEEVLNYTTQGTTGGDKDNYWFALKDDKCTFQPVGDAFWGDDIKTPLNIRTINQSAFKIFPEQKRVENAIFGMLRIRGGSKTYFYIVGTNYDGTNLRDPFRLDKAWSLILKSCPGKKTRF